MENLFVYGTLKDPNVRKEVIGRVVEGHQDTLKGYKKSEIKIHDKVYPIVVPCSDPGSSVKGLVFPVTPDELKLVDKYETDAYQRQKVVLRSRKSAWVYQK